MMLQDEPMRFPGVERYEVGNGMSYVLDSVGDRLWFPTHAELSFCTGKGLMLSKNPRGAGWRAVEQKFIEANPICIGCGGSMFLQVHHKKPFHLYPKLELDVNNLCTLCMNPNRICHYRLGHSFDWHAFNPRVLEDAAEQLERIKHRSYT